MTFDINAPIERQRTRDGRKVVQIAVFEGAEHYPIVAIVEGSDGVRTHTRGGLLVSGSPSSGDLITLPEPKPLIVSYHNVYPPLLGPDGIH